ncbi:MAG TPA: hypothetical protein DCK76_00730 [Desulfotomaculum sp.]|nr:MAG: hypothetical protein XD84_1203 [Desulfotomaculum sp. 46_80]HAG09944.1 hypothetical protein [Desulfotomaculum sp.]HBY04652.1 hypothetical protein [Desulfotomaculum sp.]
MQLKQRQQEDDNSQREVNALSIILFKEQVNRNNDSLRFFIIKYFRQKKCMELNGFSNKSIFIISQA